MISVVIPSLNEEADLAHTLAALVPAAVDGLVSEVVIADGGSTDRTAEIADAAGANFIRTERGRGRQLAEGARHAKGSWLLFLHADTILQPDWVTDAVALIRAVESGVRPQTAGVFRFALSDNGLRAAFLTGIVRLRCAVLRMPYGDQGLLISRRLYDEVGGFRPMPLMEDVDLIRRLGRKRLIFFPSLAVTSARRYRADGYVRRMLRNLACLCLFYLNLPLRLLARLYG
jgi:rSAM/selenodomain-associated transferase 2